MGYPESPSALSCHLATQVDRLEPSQDRMSNLDSLARTLIREGHWSDAVRLYRDELGVSIMQAEAKVTSLAEETGVLHPERWASWFGIAFAGLSLFVLAICLDWFLA